MSKCISNWGEFSEHEYTGENATCDYCGQVSEMIAVDQLQTMRAALVAIQELHKPVWTAEPFPGGYLCGVCDIMLRLDPCPTWMLADEGLGGGQDG